MQNQIFDLNKCQEYILQNISNMNYKFDPQKIMMVYFFIEALDIINKLDILDQDTKQQIIEWTYQQQISTGGFRSGESIKFDTHHIVFTYSAICILKVLGDDLLRLNQQNILSSINVLKQSNGSFKSIIFSQENDLRFVYSALIISYHLNDFSEIDREQVLGFITSCRNGYDGGFGLTPGQESHGGACYCALSSLKLLDKLDTLPNKTQLLQWLMNRQIQMTEKVGGFCGRVNKFPDSCYSFWIGASLKILGYDYLLDKECIYNFLECCENRKGGFQKYPDSMIADPPHTCLSLHGISLLGYFQNERIVNHVLGIIDNKH